MGAPVCLAEPCRQLLGHVCDCSPAQSRGQGHLCGLPAGLGEDLARASWAYWWGSWKVSPAEVTVMVAVMLSWRAGANGSCPGAKGRGEDRGNEEVKVMATVFCLHLGTKTKMHHNH